MKKVFILSAFLVSTFLVTTAFVVSQNNAKTEAGKHPRIEKAITQLDDAIDYMEKAPDDFGGHKAAALADSKKAVQSLKAALAYRAKEDNKQGK